MNETEGAFEELLQLADPKLRPLCEGLRTLIASIDPSFVETVWPRLKIASFGIGPRKNTEHYAYIGVQNDHVNLGFYHGIMLKDPERLLKGAGKRLRHFKIRSLVEVRYRAVAELLRAAIEDRKANASLGEVDLSEGV